MQAFNRYQFHICFPIIVYLSTQVLYFELAYILPTLTKPREYIFTTSLVILYSFWWITYIQSMRITGKVVPNLLAPRKKVSLRYNHQDYSIRAKCDKEGGIYKPNRTSHCKKCGCVPRMDHHCPYINNCSGIHNLKAFLLFTGCSMLHCFQFVALSLYYYTSVLRKEGNPMTQLQTTGWILLILIIFILMIGTGGLCIATLVMIGKSVTRLDIIKGKFLLTDSEGARPNPYDLGCSLANLYQVFQHQSWLTWWIPSETKLQSDGVEFPMAPPITDQDIKSLFPKVQQLLKTPLQRSIPKDISEFIANHYEQYQNVEFIYMGEKYYLGEQEQDLKQTQQDLKISKIASQQDRQALKGVYGDEQTI